MPHHGVQSGVEQRIVQFTPRRLFQGISLRPPCECGTHGAHNAGNHHKSSVTVVRSYAVPAEKPAPAPDSIDKQPLIPYDSDEQSASGPGLAPFIPPSIQKLISVIMRHGKKDQARRIVFDASHALYNATRKPNPRPELRQRKKEFVP
jgi:hypothetical protein